MRMAMARVSSCYGRMRVTLGSPRLTASPFVSMGALSALSDLLRQALKLPLSSSNAPHSDASRSSHDQNRGEAPVLACAILNNGCGIPHPATEKGAPMSLLVTQGFPDKLGF